MVTNPYFAGKEKELLRAQIARIVQTTSIVPKGYFKKQEDSEREIVEVGEEERKLPGFEDLRHSHSWCHLAPSILKCGRTAHLQPEPPREEPPNYDPATALKELEVQDPYEERLKPLTLDSCYLFLNYVAVGDCEIAWTIKTIGDSRLYKEDYKDSTFTNGIIMIRSLVWPGAYVFYKDDRWFSFYVGFGHKADSADYYPVMPPLPREEVAEVLEQSEPNPKEGEEEEKIDPETASGFINKLREIIDDNDKFENMLNRVFDVFDVDRSGELDRKEIRNFLKFFSKELQIPMGHRPIQEFFRGFDTDKSGLISKEELSDPLKGCLLYTSPSPRD
eukprot:TRINITY_DN7084_c0_g1_i1.p1 TRINITY_DN7084_c0_g1~~TRINITY_DN7084_c0_g1_i1.p1  ORF type:complete len:333 (-),score=90.59 TRINITY_DN7084_c0_g1_i1:53-1051(-)